LSSPETLPLLLEIGCEEIPARFLVDAERDLGKKLEAALRGARLLAESAQAVQTYSTPRRLVAYTPQLLASQPDKTEEIIGPPAKVALDEAGKPTRAALSFAERNAIAVSRLKRVTTPKGEYLAISRTIKGKAAREILAALLPGVIGSLTFPKNMYWVAKSGPLFVRPIRWIVALLGEGIGARTIRFTFAGVKSGNATCGHRFLSKGVMRVDGFKEYRDKLREGGVEIDRLKRRQAVQEQCDVLLARNSFKYLKDEYLQSWIDNSNECPSALLGDFEPRFLHLPREILITVMRDHQKYFAVEDAQGNLQPHFIAILNRPDDPKGLIQQGHEKVLTARFTDAEFFWDSDQKIPLRDRQEQLARVTYEAALGSYAEKINRMKMIAEETAVLLEQQGVLTIGERGHALRAINLAKCDLTTQMVQEFTELQGVVGGLYAKAQGEDAAVADAIYDHYLPGSMEDRIPRSIAGAVVSLADKIDSVAAGFAIGRAPSGSSDPFALRRQGNGIIKIILDKMIPISLISLAEKSLSMLDIEKQKPQVEVLEEVQKFLGERLRFYLESVKGLKYDTVRAVLAAGVDPPLDALRRAEALQTMRGGEDFEALCVAAKRIKNILAKSEKAGEAAFDPKRLEAGPEQDLYGAYEKVAAASAAHRQVGEHEAALEAIASLRPSVDTFFDKVLVNAPDPEVRTNRLKLLKLLDDMFSGIAHFAEIVVAGTNVDASTLAK
jgi:glycyl-tRNA synthetase beta chain